ncbi:NPCBM/NEW2 domain-containing protein [bacterium]|nr:NPCBM/NEW2 domain-containing protein [bacterium]
MKLEALIKFLLPLIFLPFLHTKPLLENKFLSLQLKDNSILLLNKFTNSTLRFPLSSMKLNIGSEWCGGDSLKIKEMKIGKESCKILFQPLKGQGFTLSLELNLSISKNLLRKWLSITLLEADHPLYLYEIILEGFTPADEPETFPNWWQSQPIIGVDYFLGIEFPVSYWRKEGNVFILGHQPGVLLKGGETFQSKKEVIGVSPLGEARKFFEEYIESLRPSPKCIHFNYNSWWSLPVIYKQDDVLKLISYFRENLYKRYKVNLDTFTIDAGWSEPKSIWRISTERFKDGFSTLVKELKKMNCKLGLWLSPSSCYPFAQNLEWARENGYEVLEMNNQLFACLAKGNRYQQDMKKSLLNIVKLYDIHQLKLDGYVPECPENAHNHLPGVYSREAIAEGLIDICKAVRRVQPDIWLEATCFGWEPSPWWLMYINSVVGPYGDDAPYGRVPCPIYRESYTSARDFYNLHDNTPIPMVAKEVLGIVHQTDEPIYNDAVITLMRGHFFQSLYINPRFMSDEEWRFLAELIRWARKNQGILRNTRLIRPADWKVSSGDWTRDRMSRLPYGYAHWDDKGVLLCLRNPFIEEREFELVLDSSIGVKNLQRDLSLIRLYPVKEVLTNGLAYGDRFKILLKPYETTLLLLQHKSADYTPFPMLLPLVEVEDFSYNMNLVRVRKKRPAYGANYTSLIGEAEQFFKLSAEGKISLPEGGELLVLLEYPSAQFDLPYARAYFNGKEVETKVISSETGWAASGPYSKTEYWAFVKIPLKGFGKFKLEVYSKDKGVISLWALSEGKRSDMVQFRDELLSFPSYPNWKARRSKCLIATTEFQGSEIEGELPVEYISQGVYLDSLQPKEAKQDWGELHRNKSVQGNPIHIGSRIFRRGLGTHANSRIVYQLDGRYRKFTAYVGADREVSANTVVFEVWADGKKLWESGLMTVNDEPKRIEVDITGVKTLELRVTDGGDGINADHADWADAILY